MKVAVSAPYIASINPPEGKPATPITLAGSGFGSLKGQVFFNGTVLNTSSWSPTEVVVSLPYYTRGEAVEFRIRPNYGSRESLFQYSNAVWFKLIYPTITLTATCR